MKTASLIEERIVRTIAKVLDVDEASLTDQSSPENIEAWDSLNHLNLIMALETEFGLSFSSQHALQMQSVGMIRSLLEQTATSQGNAISFCDCNADKIPDLKEFITESYGENYVLATNDAYFNWQYCQTPWNAGPGSHLRLALFEGRIVGCLGYIPVEFTIAGRNVRACWLANWMVDPNDRHLGVGPLLVEQVSQGFELTLALGANSHAADILVRMGWTDLGMLQRYIRVLDLKKTGTLTAAGKLDWSVETSTQQDGADSDAFVKQVERFDGSATQLWDAISAGSTRSAGTRRTASFLNWRYAEHCQFAYRMFEARAGDQLVGLGVYRVEQVQDMTVCVARIVELVSQPGVDGAVLTAMIEDSRRHGAALVDYFCGGLTHERLMKDHGFLPGTHTAVTQLPYLFQPVDRHRTGIRFLADMGVLLV